MRSSFSQHRAFLLALFGSVLVAGLLEQSNRPTVPPFGHQLLPLFALQSNYTNLNHGSFGSPPQSVIASQRQWYDYVEENPDRWYRYHVYSEMDDAREIVANYVGADKEDIVFVLNASHGVNAVLRSLKIAPPGKILYLNLAYQMVKNTLQFMHEMYSEQLVQVNITFPTSNEQIVQLVKEAFDNHTADGGIQLVSFSHITSVPSLILPIEELIPLCQSRGAMVLIDGAHAMGHIPIQLNELNADFYVSNGHKWFYTPKGSAFLWARKDRQPLIYPTVISDEGQGATVFQMEFSWEGTMDYSAYLSFPAALQFRNQFGDNAIMSYIHDLAVEGGQLLAEMWNTDLLVDPSMIGAMVNVRLPVTSQTNMTVVRNLPTLLLERYTTWVPVYPLQGNWYTRVSAQIYNELSDFKYLGNAVTELLSSNQKTTHN
jgi:selenocysteine lyase/cysteine desulfurase